MGLVDGEQGDLDLAQHLLEAGRHQAFGRHVEEFEVARVELVADIALLVGRERGIEGGGLDALLSERLDLVAHQSDERRDDDGDARAAQGGNLVAEGLARPGGQEDHRVAPGDDMAHHLFLLAAEGGQAEDFSQNYFGAKKFGRFAQGVNSPDRGALLACAGPLAIPAHQRYRAASWLQRFPNPRSASFRWAAPRRSSIQSASSRACAPRDTRSRPTTRARTSFL